MACNKSSIAVRLVIHTALLRIPQLTFTITNANTLTGTYKGGAGISSGHLKQSSGRLLSDLLLLTQLKISHVTT